MKEPPLLEVRDLVVDYGQGHHRTRAVDGVSFTIAPGETVGLVGESGSGKTTIGRSIVGLAPVTSGTITFAGEDITRTSRARRRRLASSIQVVFQDPYSSLNPAKTIGQTLVEPFVAHRLHDRAERTRRVGAALERVGLAASAADRYPSQFSGGQRQRIAIARALMLEPRLVVCDEPVSALDLSIQAQILNLLADLRDELGISYLFVAHNLAVVRHLSQRVIVLYRGQIMESGPTDIVYDRPAHPYTRALIASEPVPDPSLQRERRAIRLSVANRSPLVRSAGHTPGCVYAPRCSAAADPCHRGRPPLEALPSTASVACVRHAEIVSDHHRDLAPSFRQHVP